MVALVGDVGWVMERMCMLREGRRSGCWGLRMEGTNPRCAMVVVPPGISSGSARTSKVRARDSKTLFPLEIRCTPCVLTGHSRNGCDTPRSCSSFFPTENEKSHVYFVANRGKTFSHCACSKTLSFVRKVECASYLVS